MAVSSLKLTNPEVVSMLRTKRQSLAGIVRQLLLDADRQRSGRKTPLNRCSNVELRHEVELLQQVLALLTQHGAEPQWVRAEHREQLEMQRFALKSGQSE